ncbi:MAG: glycosyltransferase [Rhodospirillales bacterium]
MPMIEAMAPCALVVAAFILLSQIAGPQATWARWLVLALTVALVVRYLPWRLAETVATSDILTPEGVWVWFLFAIECVFIADLLKILLLRCRFEDRSAEADANQRALESRPESLWPSVDVFIPTYNEPLDVLERSIIGAKNLDYPSFTVHVLDDGDRVWLREFCQAQGVNYITRSQHIHAKAGNINNALARTSGTLVAVFDADFVPYRWFLKRCVGFFDDEKIGIVQTPQHFFNRDPVQRNLWIADRWPDEQRLFFDHLAPSLDAWNAMFCCGSCAVLRRKAVEAIGGIPTQSITEDILTTLEMLRAGYATRYLNERLSIGLAAESLEAFYVQRQRWCQGGIQTLFLRSGPLLGRGMTWIQRLLLFPIYWVFHIPARLLVVIIPLLYFWFGLEPLQNARGPELLFWQIPVLLCGWASSLFYFGRKGMPILNDGAAILVSLRLAPVVLTSLIRPFGRPFKVTPKGSLIGSSRVSFLDAGLIALLIVLSIGGFWLNIPSDTRIVEDDSFIAVGGFWTAINVITLTIALLMCFENPLRRAQERFPVALDARVGLGGGGMQVHKATVTDISLTGASLRLQGQGTIAAEKGSSLSLDIPGTGAFPARIVRSRNGEIGIDFEPEPMGENRAALIRLLYTTGIDNSAQVGQPLSLLSGLAKRLWGEQR